MNRKGYFRGGLERKLINLRSSQDEVAAYSLLSHWVGSAMDSFVELSGVDL